MTRGFVHMVCVRMGISLGGFVAGVNRGRGVEEAAAPSNRVDGGAVLWAE